jgi:hypothetical protein
MLSYSELMRMLRTGVAALAACILVACGGGGGNSGSNATPPSPSATAISGIIQDGTGNPLSGATVLTANQAVSSGVDGSYKFNIDAALTGVVVLVKKAGFTSTAKEVPVAAGSTTQINIKLFADQASVTFNATAGSTIAVNGAQVVIPANALKLADGGDYTGTVSVSASYYNPDTVQGVQAFAGPYRGLDSSTTTPIVSMGFMEVKLADSTGRPLQLKIGSSATLVFPASSNSAGATTVPLWFYDEALKIWVRQGDAARQPNGTYQGTVSHFTLWNADFLGVSATLKGCFRNAAGQPVTNVGIMGLRGTGYEHVLRLISGNTTGDFTISLVPANLPLQLYSAVSPPAFAPIAVSALAPNEVRTLSSCITATAVTSTTPYVITAPTNLFTATTTPPVGTVTGTAVFSGTYTGTYGGAETGTFDVTIDAAGSVTGTTFAPSLGQGFAVTGQVNASGGVALTASGTAGSAQFSGTVTAAGAISGIWNFIPSTLGGGTFIGQRVP